MPWGKKVWWPKTSSCYWSRVVGVIWEMRGVCLKTLESSHTLKSWSSYICSRCCMHHHWYVEWHNSEHVIENCWCASILHQKLAESEKKFQREICLISKISYSPKIQLYSYMVLASYVLMVLCLIYIYFQTS